MATCEESNYKELDMQVRVYVDNDNNTMGTIGYSDITCLLFSTIVDIS